MSGMSPFAELIGPCKIFLAPYGTAIPPIDATPGASWVEMGPTDGNQTITSDGALTYYGNNDGNTETTARRPLSTVTGSYTLVGITLENAARVLSNIGNINNTTSGAASVREIGFERPYVPGEYALVMRGETDSPYGILPAQNYIPRIVFDGPWEETKGKEDRAEVACEWHALRDPSQPAGKQLGWKQAQVS